MNVTRILSRGSLALAILALAGCQTAPLQQGAATEPTEATVASPAPTAEAAGETPMQTAAETGTQVAVFLADLTGEEGWRPVSIGGESTLYLDVAQPIVTRNDLTGVQAGVNQEGQGLLALMLSEEASSRVRDMTARNPNKRLALVVGRTLMSAPSYKEPVATGQLIFPVGTEENAMAAARAIAGVDAEPASGPASGQGMSGQP